MHGHDVPVVLDSDPQAAIDARRFGAASARARSDASRSALCRSHPAVQPAAIEQEQSGARVLIDLQIRLYLVGQSPAMNEIGELSRGSGTFGLQSTSVLFRDPYALHLIDTGS